MDQLYTDYLQIIREVCTNSEKRHVFHGEKLKDLYRLSSEHFTVPFLLPYTAPSDKLFFQIRQQTKMMMLHYYQIEQFTVRLTSLLKEHHIPCILLKGISLAAIIPHRNCENWEMWTSIFLILTTWIRQNSYWNVMTFALWMKSVTIILRINIRFPGQTALIFWSSISGSLGCISMVRLIRS